MDIFCLVVVYFCNPTEHYNRSKINIFTDSTFSFFCTFIRVRFSCRVQRRRIWAAQNIQWLHFGFLRKFSFGGEWIELFKLWNVDSSAFYMNESYLETYQNDSVKQWTFNVMKKNERRLKIRSNMHRRTICAT